jgi:hypothetical protein
MVSAILAASLTWLPGQRCKGMSVRLPVLSPPGGCAPMTWRRIANSLEQKVE